MKPPEPPRPPAPPVVPMAFPVDITVGKYPTDRRRSPSLYSELFGEDLSPVYEALDAPWADLRHSELAQHLTTGTKSIHSLSTDDRQLLDELATRCNSGIYSNGTQARDQQLIEQAEEARREEDASLESDVDMSGGDANFTGAYGE